jgi:putative spermidine/putrescine transport system ATP-binding protein
MTDERTVELALVTKRFGRTVAVDSVSLKIPAGAHCCLLGPSGCGKTTPLRIGDAVAPVWAASDARLLEVA